MSGRRGAAGLAVLLGAPVLVVILFAAAGAGVASVVFGGGGGGPVPSGTAVVDIPGEYLALYQQAAATECPGLDWTVLAGIGKVGSDHGRSRLPGVRTGHDQAGTQGPMQLLPAVFAAHSRPVPAGGADPPSADDPVDAVYAAARKLCADGARHDVNTAVAAYKPSPGYVRQVLDWSARYAAATAPNPAADKVVGFARAQLGVPYQWGGNGPPGDWGYDCSGLAKAAYAAAGVVLPRTAQQQYDALGIHPPGSGQPQPGDLLFYGTPARIHHVGIYVGGGRMIDAPDFDLVVRLESYRWAGDDFAGYGRPPAGQQ